jgi:hypothetical protein
MAIYTLYRGQLNFTKKLYASAFRQVQSKKHFLEFLYQKSIVSNKSIFNRLISEVLSYSEDECSKFIDLFLKEQHFSEIGDEYRLFLLSDYLEIRKKVKDIMFDFLSRKLKKKKVIFPEDIIEATAQHYGVYRTGFLDVTWDESVAIWFATHKFIKDGLPGKGRYEPVEKSKWGFLYVIRVDSEKIFLSEFPLTDFLVEIDKIDLGFIRIERQRGAALYTPWDSFSVSEFPLDFTKIFDVEVIDLKKKYKRKKYRSASDCSPFTQEYLFPGANEDELYKILRKSDLHTFPS